MKKTILLQSDLSYIIATLGHLDMLVIADAGLPIPAETVRIIRSCFLISASHRFNGVTGAARK